MRHYSSAPRCCVLPASPGPALITGASLPEAPFIIPATTESFALLPLNDSAAPLAHLERPKRFQPLQEQCPQQPNRPPDPANRHRVCHCFPPCRRAPRSGQTAGDELKPTFRPEHHPSLAALEICRPEPGDLLDGGPFCQIGCGQFFGLEEGSVWITGTLLRDLHHLGLRREVIEATHQWKEHLEWPWPLQEALNALEYVIRSRSIEDAGFGVGRHRAWVPFGWPPHVALAIAVHRHDRRDTAAEQAHCPLHILHAIAIDDRATPP